MHDRLIGEGPAARAVLCAAAILTIVVILVLPLGIVFGEAASAGPAAIAAALSSPDAQAAIRLTLLVAVIVVPLNTACGILAAWCLARFRFPGRRALASLVGLPFSVSPVVAGLAVVLLYGTQGWLAPLLAHNGIRIVFALPGIVLCTLFVTVPFVAGSLLPLLEARGQSAAGREEDEAAATLGAGLWQMLWWVVLPRVRWGLAFGVLLTNARAIGEFGAVAVVSGRIRGETVTMPLQVELLYNEYDLPAAFTLAAVLAALALLTVAARTLLEARQRAAERAGEAAFVAP